MVNMLSKNIRWRVDLRYKKACLLILLCICVNIMKKILGKASGVVAVALKLARKREKRMGIPAPHELQTFERSTEAVVA